MKEHAIENQGFQYNPIDKANWKEEPANVYEAVFYTGYWYQYISNNRYKPSRGAMGDLELRVMQPLTKNIQSKKQM